MAALPMVELTEGASNMINPLPFVRSTEGKLTNTNNVTRHRIAEGEIAGDGHEDVDECSNSYACHHNTGCPKVRVITDLVDYGE